MTNYFDTGAQCCGLLFQRLTRRCEFIVRGRLLVVLVHDNSEQVVNAPIHVRMDEKSLGGGACKETQFIWSGMNGRMRWR